jgi:regulator of protease activity HflC (stomatin/prohibitin superfamily)
LSDRRPGSGLKTNHDNQVKAQHVAAAQAQKLAAQAQKLAAQAQSDADAAAASTTVQPDIPPSTGWR